MERLLVVSENSPTDPLTEPPVNVSFEISPTPGARQYTLAQMHVAMLEGDFAHEASLTIGTSLPPGRLVPRFMQTVRTSVATWDRTIVAEAESCALIVSAYDDSTHISLWANETQLVELLWDEVTQLASAVLDKRNRAEIRVVAWSDGVDGKPPKDRSTLTPVEPWSVIRRNYPVAAGRAIDGLMSMQGAPSPGGRLILWHGAPGTGKTNAVTSLIDAWRPWCDAHLITDPERFFANPNYLMTVLQRRGEADLAEPLPSMDEARRWRWKLIVCEDADEYIRGDARQRSGPALGRLLNAADGILGRDSRSIILLTTNDEFGSLHPALTRPGRCLAAIEFPAFSRAEAAAWCPTGVTPPTSGATIAELYAWLEGDRRDSESLTTGLYL